MKAGTVSMVMEDKDVAGKASCLALGTRSCESIGKNDQEGTEMRRPCLLTGAARRS